MFALFDLDDTLHDKTASLKVCADVIYTEFLFDLAVNRDEFTASFLSENCIIQPKAQVFDILAQGYSLDISLKTAMFHFFDTQFHTFSKRFDHVIETMDFLKSENVRLACVTNGRDFFQRNKIEALGLANYFDVIVTSGELGVKKPNPLIFNTALEQLGAQAKECIFIGDSLTADMLPAKQLGMKTVWVNRVNPIRSKPDYVDAKLESYSQFVDIWQQLA